MSNAYRDENDVPTLIVCSNADGFTPVRLYGDPITHRLLVDIPNSGRTLTVENPTGTVNDSNVTFTVVNQPLYIVVNGAQYVVGTGTYVSYSGGTITLSSAVGTGGFIRSFYNA